MFILASNDRNVQYQTVSLPQLPGVTGLTSLLPQEDLTSDQGCVHIQEEFAENFGDLNVVKVHTEVQKRDGDDKTVLASSTCIWIFIGQFTFS